MAITLAADAFLLAFKTGLAKVKEVSTSLYAEKNKLFLTFQGPAVRYQAIIDVDGSSLPQIDIDAQGLYKLISTYTGDIKLDMDGNYLSIRKGRSRVRVPCTNSGSFQEDISGDSEGVEDTEVFKGWIKKHPLKTIKDLNLKRVFQAIKDNVTKTELVVEASWGKTDLLKIKLVDQFHGILVTIKLDAVPLKKKVLIRIPLSSFLNLLDIEGDLYIDPSKVIIKNDQESLECRFITGSVFGSIDDMEMLSKQATKGVSVGAKPLNEVVKKAVSVSENDDYIQFSTKKENLIMSADTVKAEIIEAIPMQGKLSSTFKLSPKNLLDITSTLIGEVLICDIGNSVVFKAAKGNLTISAAIVKTEA